MPAKVSCSGTLTWWSSRKLACDSVRSFPNLKRSFCRRAETASSTRRFSATTCRTRRSSRSGSCDFCSPLQHLEWPQCGSGRHRNTTTNWPDGAALLHQDPAHRGVEKTSALSRYPALVIKLTGLSVVDMRRLCQPLRTGSSRRCSGLDRDWYVSALPNQGHASEDGGPQIDGCENEYEHCAAVGTRGDLHLVLEERMLLIGADVKADVIGPKTFIERNAYLISAHGLAQPFPSRINRTRCRPCRRRPDRRRGRPRRPAVASSGA
jgi:hypothetical protein